MESSKFWKLRMGWLRLKQLFGSRHEVGSSKSLAEENDRSSPVPTVKIAPTSAVAKHLSDQAKHDSIETPARLHLGCGDHLLKGWINIDINDSEEVVKLNLTQALPFPTESVEFIFSEHFIEHITCEEAHRLLTECYRVLLPKGVLRISTPDLRKLVNEYLAEKTGEWHDVGWFPATPCQMVNEGMRLWGHQFLYDAKELTALIKACGFQEITAVHWRESRYTELRNLEVRPFHNEVILEAVKLEAIK